MSNDIQEGSFNIPDQPGQTVVINEKGALVLHLKGWMKKEVADTLLEQLVKEIPWSQYGGAYEGKPYKVPRLMYFCGPEGRIHSYGGITHDLNQWHPSVSQVLDRIEIETKYKYNSALLNYYRNGKDYIAEHSDRETNGSYNRSVATVSLGGPRDFQLRCKFEKRDLITIKVESGDFLGMYGNTQLFFSHMVPKRANVGPRISLTFRELDFDK